MKVCVVGNKDTIKKHIEFNNQFKKIDICCVAVDQLTNYSSLSELYDIYFYSSLDEAFNNFKPDYVYFTETIPSLFDLIKNALKHNCNVVSIDPVNIQHDQILLLHETASNQNVNISLLNSYLNHDVISEVQSILMSGSVGDISEINIEQTINSSNVELVEYSAPNVLPRAYNDPFGPFNFYAYKSISLILAFVDDVDNVSVNEACNNILPFDLSDAFLIKMSSNNINCSININISDNNNKFILMIGCCKGTIEANINTGEVKVFRDKFLNKTLSDYYYHIRTSYKMITNRSDSFETVLNNKIKHTINNCYSDNISVDDCLEVSSQIDAISSLLKNSSFNIQAIYSNNKNSHNFQKILITGATGSLGRTLIKRLVNSGYEVRAFVRKLADISSLREYDIDICYGDVMDYSSLDAALDNVSIIIHAAAESKGADSLNVDDLTKPVTNIVSLCQKHMIKKLIYISSCSVYEIANIKSNAVVHEDSQLERYPARRGVYTYMKLLNEIIVTDAMRDKTINAVCLRPGTFYGASGQLYTPMMGFTLFSKFKVIIGSGSMQLPLVYLENLVDVIQKTIDSNIGIGKIYNVVDDKTVNKKYYVDKLLRKINNNYYLYIPYGFFYCTVFMYEMFCKLVKRKPIITIYRLNSSQKSINYSSSQIIEDFKWIPPHTVDEAFEAIIHIRTKDKEA